MQVYADNAATTAMSEVALAAMNDTARRFWGNPSSLHTVGQEAKEVLDEARAAIACLVGAADPREIYFTSGGSESDNQAIRSAALNGEKKGKKHIITSAFEHHAVMNTLKKLEKAGFEVEYLPVHEDGIVRLDELEAALREDTALVTIMYANNEIGTVQPIREIGALCRERKIPFHTDAVQAIGHLPVNVQADNIDMMSLSAHKFHGPKGLGVLYVRKGITLRSLIEGGAQERGKRAGTENLPSIVATAAALKDAVERMDEVNARLVHMRDRLIDGLLAAIPHTALNGTDLRDTAHRLPGIASFCFEGIEGESLLLRMDLAGIQVSSGSACASGSLEPSHVLLAIGRPHDVAHGSMRMSLSDINTEEQIDYMLKTVPEIVALLRNMSPVWEALEEGRIEHLI